MFNTPKKVEVTETQVRKLASDQLTLNQIRKAPTFLRNGAQVVAEQKNRTWFYFVRGDAQQIDEALAFLQDPKRITLERDFSRATADEVLKARKALLVKAQRRIRFRMMIS